ncbi:hypothetical protein MPSEU_000562200 [Mayamaea pseudoterrestris]|nr:hypothetical protein MPSEU_000562200 [Mayamaea pseudoterrestris]
MMKVNFILSICVSIIPCSLGRSWVNLVDPAIYLASAIDYGRVEKSLEHDPYEFTSQYDFNTQAPTSKPSNAVEEAAESPTLAPTQTTESPSFAPTTRYENVIGNGGCPVGKHLYEIRMVDSWGDGWDGTLMTILGTRVSQDSQYATTSGTTTSSSVYSSVQVKQKQATIDIFKGRLSSGSEGYRYICLQANVCYSVNVDGGTWQSEIVWELRRVELGIAREDRDEGLATAKGGAPEACQFSIPNSYAELACPVNCGLKKTTSPTTLSTSSPAPTPTPTAPPSYSPSQLPVPSTSHPTLSPLLQQVGSDADDDNASTNVTTTEQRNASYYWKDNRNKAYENTSDSDFASDRPSLSPSQDA